MEDIMEKMAHQSVNLVRTLPPTCGFFKAARRQRGDNLQTKRSQNVQITWKVSAVKSGGAVTPER